VSYSLVTLLVVVATLGFVASAITLANDAGVGLQPWHRVTPDEAYRVGTRGRYPFVARRRIDFQHGPAAKGAPAAYDLPTGGGNVIATFDAAGGVEQTSAITFYNGLTDPSTEVVAHEYGHALLWDYLNGPLSSAQGTVDVGYAFRAVSAAGPGERLAPQVARLYPRLLPLIDEYGHQPDAFGPYASSQFGEWFAEANFAHLYGRPVPPRTAAFLAGLEGSQ
jgi:hypothetical protein